MMHPRPARGRASALLALPGAALAASALPVVDELAPARGLDRHPEPLRGRLDALPGAVALRVAPPFDLIEAGDRVADVAGIGERFLALLRERELRRRQLVLLGRAEGLAASGSLRLGGGHGRLPVSGTGGW